MGIILIIIALLAVADIACRAVTPVAKKTAETPVTAETAARLRAAAAPTNTPTGTQVPPDGSTPTPTPEINYDSREAICGRSARRHRINPQMEVRRNRRRPQGRSQRQHPHRRPHRQSRPHCPTA